MAHQADAVSARVASAGVGVGRGEDGHAVQLTDFAVADRIAVADEGLLGVAGQTHQGVAARRRDQEETAVHRNVVVVQALDGATDRGIGQRSGVRGGAVVSSRTVRADKGLGGRVAGGVVVGANGSAVESAAQLNQIGVDATSQSVTGVFRVERTQRGQRLDFDDVFDQAAVLIVLVDEHLDHAVALSDQGDRVGSSLGVGGAAQRGGDIDGVTLLALEVHLLDEVRQDEVLLIGRDNLITPNLGNEVRCGSGGYAISRGKGGVCHDSNLQKKEWWST